MAEDLTNSVSVVIPTRNRASVLVKCLEALAAQTVPAREVIVVDDHSSDGTPEVVQRFAAASAMPVRLLRQPQPAGANAARNAGLAVAQGQVIAFLDDDAIAHPGWMEETLRGLSRTDAPVVTGAIRLNVNGSLVGKHRHEIAPYLAEVLTPARGLDDEIVPVTCNMAAQRWVFDRARFDEVVRPPCEEMDWLSRAGVRADFLPEARVTHYKLEHELRLREILRLAWRRGSEGGWWLRERAGLPAKRRARLALLSLATSFRGMGHALVRLCWGGVVVALGEFGKFLALVGLINRAPRVARSWR